jgi:cell filamentation protein
MAADPYVYPGTDVLRNVFDIRDAAELDHREAVLTSARLIHLADTPLPGNYDVAHLQETHRHIFGDVYPWAGEIRTVEISKGGSLFALPQHVEPYLSDVLKKLPQENYLRDLDREAFLDRITDYYADINAAHPFREGNGRTQRAFVGQLAEEAGHHIAWERLDAQRNIEASRAAHEGNNLPMRELFDDITVSPERDDRVRGNERTGDSRDRADDERTR